MWINRAHFELIAERAKDFRAWHEGRVAQLEQQFSERLAERDSTIAQQERRIDRLESERSELLQVLFKREEQRTKPPEPMPDPNASDWEAIMRRQVDDLEKPSE